MYRFYSSPAAAEAKSPRVTVVGSHENGMLNVAVSRCSKNDTFMKHKGASIAESRLLGGKTFMEFPMEECDIKTFLNVAKGVALKVERTKKVY